MPRNRRIRRLPARGTMGERFMRAVVLGLMACLAFAASAAADTLIDARVGFTADRTLTIDGRTYTGKIWTMPGKERHEQQIQGFRPVFLLRADSGFGQVVLAQLHTIVQFAIPPELKVLADKALKKSPAGYETVNGVATTKFAIDETVPEGHAKGTLWLSADGIPMKLAGTFAAQSGKTSTVQWLLSKVKIGPQPAALFDAPSGYSKLPPEAVAPLLGMKLKSTARP
jgi:hypothetical protein